MCVEIVRRAGKSPPGGAMCARPVRASSGPSSSTDPRSRPTSARSGESVVNVGVRMRSVVRADAVHLGAEIEKEPRHHFDVPDARHVGQDALVLGQETRRQQRERGVLVAFNRDTALEPVPAFDQ